MATGEALSDAPAKDKEARAVICYQPRLTVCQDQSEAGITADELCILWKLPFIFFETERKFLING